MPVGIGGTFSATEGGPTGEGLEGSGLEGSALGSRGDALRRHPKRHLSELMLVALWWLALNCQLTSAAGAAFGFLVR